jgi:hypothetical protein
MLDQFAGNYRLLPLNKKNIYRNLHDIYPNYYPLFWHINSNYLIKEISGNLDNFNNYLKAVYFSFLSKCIFRCSPENYQYCLDYLNWKYSLDLRFIFWNKLHVFLDFELSKFDKICGINASEYYALSKLDSHIKWLNDVIDYLNIQCCITNLRSKILDCQMDDMILEEISSDKTKLSNKFYTSFINTLSDVG